jgi:hypothetical protein
MHDVPGSGKGIGDASDKKDINKEALEVRHSYLQDPNCALTLE